jgi:hypothetical protein
VVIYLSVIFLLLIEMFVLMLMIINISVKFLHEIRGTIAPTTNPRAGFVTRVVRVARRCNPRAGFVIRVVRVARRWNPRAGFVTRVVRVSTFQTMEFDYYLYFPW